MIRFNQIWELYEKGKLEDEAPVVDPISPILESKSGARVSRIIEELITFSTDDIQEKLNKASLDSLVEEVNNAEQKVQAFVDLDIHDNDIYAHAVRIIKLGAAYDQRMAEDFKKAYTQFESLEEKIAQRYEFIGIEAIENYREQSRIHLDYASLLADIADQRNIDLEKYSLDKYKKQDKKRKIIEEEVNALENSCYNAIKEADNKIIKKLRKKCKSGFFSSSLHKRAKKLNSYESQLRLELLYKKTESALKGKVSFYTQELPEEKGPFSLGEYLQTIGFPQERKLYDLKSIFLEIGPDWGSKFLKAEKKIADIKPAESKDIDYINLFRYGLKRALKTGTCAREMNKNQDKRNIVESLMMAINNYISRSEKLAA